MSEITNKELSFLIKRISRFNVKTGDPHDDAHAYKAIQLAAERLAAMPDENEQVCFIMKTGINILNDGCGKAHVWKQSVNSDYEVPLYTQPQQPAPDVTIKDLRELINHFYDRRPDTSTNLLADEILNKYKVTQKC